MSKEDEVKEMLAERRKAGKKAREQASLCVRRNLASKAASTYISKHASKHVSKQVNSNSVTKEANR